MNVDYKTKQKIHSITLYYKLLKKSKIIRYHAIKLAHLMIKKYPGKLFFTMMDPFTN